MEKRPWWPSCLQSEAKNSPRQAFVMMNILCKYENSAFNTHCSRGGNRTIFAHCFITDNETPVVAILLFKMRPKVFTVKIL